MASAEQITIIKLTNDDVEKIKEGKRIRLHNDDGSNPDIVIYKEE